MSDGRRPHKNGPAEEKSALDVLEDLKKFLLSERAEHNYDLKNLQIPVGSSEEMHERRKAALKGQLATIRVVMTWIKDRKKHLTPSDGPKTDWDGRRRVDLQNFMTVRKHLMVEADRIAELVTRMDDDAEREEEGT